jgi:hypothetical protein
MIETSSRNYAESEIAVASTPLVAGEDRAADQGWLIDARPVPSDLSVLGEVRRAVRAALNSSQVGPIADDVVLVASELVANALRHGCSVDPDGEVLDDVSSAMPAAPAAGVAAMADGMAAPADRVRFGVCRWGRDIMLMVCDPSPAAPVQEHGDPVRADGRGLEIVAALSSAWGWTPGRMVGRGRFAAAQRPVAGTADHQGKIVWARFRVGVA